MLALPSPAEHHESTGFAMLDQDKSKQELIAELAEMRRRVASLQGIDADRKSAEEALRLSESRYRALAESTKDIIFILDRQGTLLYANQAASHCIGIPSRDIVGKRQADLFPPEMARSQIEKIGRVIAVGEVIEYDDLFHFGPAEVWLRIHLIPLRDEAGQITSVMGVCHNITERKQAEEELAKSKTIFQAAIDCLPFNFFALGLDGRYMLQNAVSKAQQRVDVIGKRPEEVCPNEHDLAIWLDNNRRALAGEKVEGEVTLSLGGEERFYHNIIAPIRDREELYGILGVNIDISEKKRAEQALQKAHDELEQRVEERTAELAKANENLDIFRKFAEASGQGFSMADLDGRLIYLNPALCRMLDEERPEDRVGQHLSTCYSEESNRRGKAEIEPALMREGHWAGELPMLSRRGKSIPTWQNSFVIRDERGSPFRLAVVITDMTQRKRAEEALRQSEERFRVAFEEAPLGIVMVIGDGCLVRVNRTFCRMGGYSEEELIGKPIRSITHPEDRERSEELTRRVLAGVIPSFALEKRYLRKPGDSSGGRSQPPRSMTGTAM